MCVCGVDGGDGVYVMVLCGGGVCAVECTVVCGVCTLSVWRVHGVCGVCSACGVSVDKESCVCLCNMRVCLCKG